MSTAKETLLRAVRGDLCLCGHLDCPALEAVVDAFRAEVLREASQKVRLEASSWIGWPDTEHAMNKAADLIDPDKPAPPST